MQDLIKSNEWLIGCFNSIFANNTLQKPLIFAYDEVDSTNTIAKLYMENGGTPGDGGALFFTRTQRAGRGTRMRTFESPRDGGLYMSLVVLRSEVASYATRLTMIAAVSVCRALKRATGDNLPVKIKWVNDITIDDKKLAGILTETKLDECGMTKYVIIGIGLNLKDAEHSREVKQIMTTLGEHGVEISAEELCALITEELLLAINSEKDDIIDEYRALSSIIGRRVYVSTKDENYEATTIDIADDGALVCMTDTGERVSLISADVSIKPHK